MTDVTVKIFHIDPAFFRDACMYSKSDKIFSAERAKNIYLGKEAGGVGYALAGTIVVRDLEDEDLTLTALETAYSRSQNFDKSWNEYPCRSTSVGDIMVIDNKVYIVASFGFDLLMEI